MHGFPIEQPMSWTNLQYSELLEWLYKNFDIATYTKLLHCIWNMLLLSKTKIHQISPEMRWKTPIIIIKKRKKENYFINLRTIFLLAKDLVIRFLKVYLLIFSKLTTVACHKVFHLFISSTFYSINTILNMMVYFIVYRW